MLDVHTHIFPPRIAHRLLKELQARYGISPVGSDLAEDLIRRLKKSGFSRAVVHTAATAPAQVIPANNWSIEIKKRYPELIPFGTIHPGFDRWEKELNRLEKNGIKGLKLHPDFQGFWLNDKRLEAIFEAIGEKFFLMIHIGDRLPAHKSPSCPVKLRQIIKKFPQLKIIAAHLGGYLQWDLALEHIVGKDIFLDTSSTIGFIQEDT
ncbi:amidohydrolase family protein [Desulfovulcanus sp.]